MKPSQALIQVIRGEAGWQTLVAAGIDVRHNHDRWEFSANASNPVYPTIDDVSTGFINLWFKSEELVGWASFLLAAAPLISLDRLEASPEGQELLEALWDVSSGEAVDCKLLQRLRG